MTKQDLYTNTIAAEPEEDFVSLNENASLDTTFIDFLTLLARRKLLIAAVSGAAVIAGLVYSCWILSPLFTATTRIMTPQQTQPSAMMLMNQLTSIGAGSLASAGSSGLGLRSPNDLYIGLLNSQPIADAIIKQFGLTGVYNARDMTGARKVLGSKTEIKSEKSGLLSIAVTDSNKARAAGIANAYTEQLHMLTRSLAVTEASQRRLFYEDQLKSAKEDLIAAELAFQQIQQRKGLVQPELQAQGVVQSITALHARIAAKEVEVQALRTYSTEKNPDRQLAEE